ncbi:MAG: metallophosphoesterase [Clostridia bacterium]|nr:metallophosphoesterase [Clostridia bacterium]
MKKFLALILSVLLVISCFPVAMAEETDKTFSIATVNDIHYYPESLAGDKREAFYTYLTGHNCVYNDLDAILDAALASLEYEVKNNGVKYIALVGDLTTNGEYEGHVALAEKLLAFEEKTGAQILVTPGNHDINNPRASQFINDNKKEEARITTPTDFYNIYKELGFSDAYHQFADFTAETGGCLSYSVKTGDGYRLILADCGKFTPDVTESGIAKQETAGKFTPELLEWVLSEARDAKKDGEIPLLFTHWNMSGANYFHEYLMQGFVIDDGYMVSETLADAGINYAFGGHQHISDVAITYSDSGNPMYSVITPTLTQFPFAYRVTDFKKNADGGLDVTFYQRDCDEYEGVKALSGNGTYPSPYRITGFYKQFGYLDATEYIFGILKSTLDKYVNAIRAEGSIVKYVEKELGIDIEKTVNAYLLGGIRLDGQTVLSGENVMSFLNDLDTQIMTKYIYNKQETYAVIKSALRNLLDAEISGIPCTKFIDSYGFGDPSHGGTLGDAVFSVLATMYLGNEDISDDLFLQDIIEFSGTPEFLDLLISLIKKYVVEDVLLDNILASIDLNLDKLFVGETSTIGEYVQLFFMLVVAFLDLHIDPCDMKATLNSLADCFRNFTDVSLGRIVEAVLGTGLIPYGDNVDSLVDNLVAMFITEDTKAAATYQAKIVIGGMVQDDTKDFDVTYTNNGLVKVIPTKEDMRLPANVTVTPAEDNSTSFTVSWLTKYSVTGTDITVTDKDGKEITDCEITKNTEEASYTAPGFDAGTFAILPWTHKIIKHTVTVKGLEAGTEYKYTIGDSLKGFMSEGSVKTAPDKTEGFTFIQTSQDRGFIPSYFEDFSASLKAADKLYPEWSFLAYTGSFTGKGDNDDMWSFGIDSAEEYFAGKMTAYAAGETDLDSASAQSKFFPVSHAPAQISDSGLYYSYNYGGAHFSVINVNNLTSGGALSREQTEWLKNDLKNSEEKWNIILMGETPEDNTALASQLESIAKEYGADLIIEGTKTGSFTAVTENGISYKTAGETDLPVFSAITVSEDFITVRTYTVKGSETAEIGSFKIGEGSAGDADLDGIVTSSDARITLRAAVGLEKLPEKSVVAADIDGNAKITSDDARIILRAAVGLESIA